MLSPITFIRDCLVTAWQRVVAWLLASYEAVRASLLKLVGIRIAEPPRTGTVPDPKGEKARTALRPRRRRSPGAEPPDVRPLRTVPPRQRPMRLRPRRAFRPRPVCYQARRDYRRTG